MKLRDIAHARTGDKGDISNIAVIAYDPSDWPRLETQLTEERVARHFAGTGAGQVTRYAPPQFRALNFVI